MSRNFLFVKFFYWLIVLALCIGSMLYTALGLNWNVYISRYISGLILVVGMLLYLKIWHPGLLDEERRT